jgi:hypothetical protein
MPARIRSFVAALTVAALLGSTAAPAFAEGFGTHDDTTAYASSVPIVFDVLLLRLPDADDRRRHGGLRVQAPIT